jgi:hypothetical protein
MLKEIFYIQYQLQVTKTKSHLWYDSYTTIQGNLNDSGDQPANEKNYDFDEILNTRVKLIMKNKSKKNGILMNLIKKKTLMLKAIIFTTVILLCLTNCDKETAVFKYDDNQLRIAWQENDSMYLKSWISNLDNLDFPEFASRISEYANETNFLYGNIDPEGDVEARWSKQEIKIWRRNMGQVYYEYNKSCVFLNKLITKEDTYSLCLKYWRDTVLSDHDIDSLRRDLQAICNKVNNSANAVIHRPL